MKTLLVFSLALAFQIHDLVNPALVSAAGELGINEGVDHRQYRLWIIDTAAEGDEVRIVVFLGHCGGEDVLGEGAADAMDFVCADGYADAGAAAEDAEVITAAEVLVASEFRHVGIVDGILRGDSEVIDVDPPLFEMVDDPLCQGYRPMVVRYYYFHPSPAFGPCRGPDVLLSEIRDSMYSILMISGGRTSFIPVNNIKYSTR